MASRSTRRSVSTPRLFVLSSRTDECVDMNEVWAQRMRERVFCPGCGSIARKYPCDLIDVHLEEAPQLAGIQAFADAPRGLIMLFRSDFLDQIRPCLKHQVTGAVQKSLRGGRLREVSAYHSCFTIPEWELPIRYGTGQQYRRCPGCARQLRRIPHRGSPEYRSHPDSVCASRSLSKMMIALSSPRRLSSSFGRCGSPAHPETDRRRDRC